jgi:hypothetical protein
MPPFSILFAFFDFAAAIRLAAAADLLTILSRHAASSIFDYAIFMMIDDCRHIILPIAFAIFSH